MPLGQLTVWVAVTRVLFFCVGERKKWSVCVCVCVCVFVCVCVCVCVCERERARERELVSY